MTRVGINGFGRIGRAFFRLAQADDDVEVVGINDLAPLDTLAYLLKYDSAQGQADFSVETHNSESDEEGQYLVVDNHEIPMYVQKDPADLPWGDLDVDVVVESTGFFTDYDKASAHLDAGAKRVVISAPVKQEGEDVHGVTALMGVNDGALADVDISSNASCTTNAGGGVIRVLHNELGVRKAMLNTVHAYTASQSLVDGPNKKVRRGRAAAQNIVPSSTGSAIATTKAIPELTGKFDGIALRVPVVAGSIADITFVAERETSVEEVNEILTKAAESDWWKDIFAVSNEPLVSSDIIGTSYAAIVDLQMTRVVAGDLVKVLAWYDNEMGYTNMLLKHVKKVAEIAEMNK